jgi:hypothetical protein
MSVLLGVENGNLNMPHNAWCSDLYGAKLNREER